MAVSNRGRVEVLEVRSPDRAGDPARRRLRKLDACLEALEAETASGQGTLSGALAMKLALHVPGVVAGMTAGEAQELIFREQAISLRRRAAGLSQWEAPKRVAGRATVSRETLVSIGPSPSPAADLGPAGARRLTDRIRSGVRDVSLLLLEAHQRRAWLALGYATWSQYVRDEFGFSRSRSYQLLDHARVVHTLSRAAGLSSVLDITPHSAELVRPWLEEMVVNIRDLTRDLSEPEAHSSVQALVREVATLSSRRQRLPAGFGEEGDAHDPTAMLERLRAALSWVAGLPSPARLATDVPTTDPLAEVLPQALRWLADLEAELRARRADVS